MADITKRVNKRAAQHLAPEEAEVVLLCEMKGTLGVAAPAMVVASLTTNDAMKRRAGERITEEGGVAKSFPAEACAVAVTPTRFLAMPGNGLTFRAPTLELDRARVKAKIVGWRGMGRRMMLRFSDGSHVEFDVPLGQPWKRFIALLGEAH